MGFGEILIIVIIIILIFGAGAVIKVFRSAGKSVKAFKDGYQEGDENQGEENNS
jgi:TatA/E family protein of Tat protein translocase